MSGCNKYAEMMNRYLDGDLPAAQISDLLDHLETCASCRNRFDALKIMAFEMRHMQVEPPKALHGQIMQAVSHSGQRRPRAYLKTFAAIAACAAALVLAINGNFVQLADNYLFNSSSKSSTAESSSQTMDAADYNNAPAPADTPAGYSGDMKSENTAEADPEIAQDTEEEGAWADLPNLPEEPEMEPMNGEGASNEAARKQDYDYDQDSGDTASNGAAPAAGGSQQPQNTLPRIDQGTKDAEVKDEPEIDPNQPLRVPALDTDEVFAFYCIALGEGSIPNAFDKNEIVRFPDKNCMYIYVKTTQFNKKGCENLLSQNGFTVREGANLPDTDESMPYGLIVIYKYEMPQ